MTQESKGQKNPWVLANKLVRELETIAELIERNCDGNKRLLAIAERARNKVAKARNGPPV
jgi:hypothetical protein